MGQIATYLPILSHKDTKVMWSLLGIAEKKIEVKDRIGYT